MIDFFSKTSSTTKKLTGASRPDVFKDEEDRQRWNISMVGTFFGEKGAVSSLLLEVADDEESRRRGLMWRKSVPCVCGMLFIGLSGGGHFWMKNCISPIDIAFMDKDWTVTKTYSMPADGGKKRYKYDVDDVMAVEAKMGFVEESGIEPGFRLVTRKLSGKEESDG